MSEKTKYFNSLHRKFGTVANGRRIIKTYYARRI